MRIARADEIPAVNDGTLTMQVEGSTKATFTANQSYAATFNVTASDLGLSQALKFVGKFDSLPTASDYSVGNVILVGNKEYVLLETSGSKAWDEMGDESSHALNTVTITGTGALSGGGNLKSNQTITHNTVSRSDTTSSEGKGFGGSFTAVDSVTSDSYGHVTKVNTKTVTLPSSVATQNAAGLMSASDKLKLDGIATGANNYTYTLPTATSDTLGGLKLGYSESGKCYKLQADSNGNGFVYVPWTDSNDNTTYTLSSSGATVTLTPSSGTAQSITVDGVSNATNADKATHDSDGNIIASTYVKNTSSQLLSGWSQTFSEIFNKESLPNGIPLLGTTVTGTSSLTGQQITVSTLDFVNLGYATSGKNYAVQKDDNGKLYVNVPWTDTNTTQTTFTAAEYGLHFRGAGSSTYSYGIDLSGYSAGLHFASSNYRITDIETGTISLSSQAFTANTSVSKSVTFHNTGYYNAQGGTTTGAKQGSLRVFLQFVGYNGEQMTCGLISLTDTGFTAYCRCNATLSASSTRYIHWLKVREF